MKTLKEVINISPKEIIIGTILSCLALGITFGIYLGRSTIPKPSHKNVPMELYIQDTIFTINSDNYLNLRNLSHDGDMKKMSRSLNYKHPTIIAIANYLTRYSNSKEQEAEDIWFFVRNRTQPYPDSAIVKEENYVRDPLETLVESYGDCEDDIGLAGSLMKARGIGVAILGFNGHAMLGIKGNFQGKYFEHNGIKYYVADSYIKTIWTTRRKEHNIGNISEKYADSIPTIYPIK